MKDYLKWSKIKTIDIKRLKYKFGKIENSDFTELKEKIKTLLF